MAASRDRVQATALQALPQSLEEGHSATAPRPSESERAEPLAMLGLWARQRSDTGQRCDTGQRSDSGQQSDSQVQGDSASTTDPLGLGQSRSGRSDALAESTHAVAVRTADADPGRGRPASSFVGRTARLLGRQFACFP